MSQNRDRGYDRHGHSGNRRQNHRDHYQHNNRPDDRSRGRPRERDNSRDSGYSSNRTRKSNAYHDRDRSYERNNGRDHGNRDNRTHKNNGRRDTDRARSWDNRGGNGNNRNGTNKNNYSDDWKPRRGRNWDGSDISMEDAPGPISPGKINNKFDYRPSVHFNPQPINEDIYFHIPAFRKYRAAAEKNGSTPREYLNGHQTLMDQTKLPDKDAWELYEREAFSLDAAYRACDQRLSITAEMAVEQFHALAKKFHIQDYKQMTFEAAKQFAHQTFKDTNWNEGRVWQGFKINAIRELLKVSHKGVITSALRLTNDEPGPAIEILQDMTKRFQKSNNIDAKLAHAYLDRFHFDENAARTQYRNDLTSEFTKDFGISEAKSFIYLENAEWNVEKAEREFRAALLNGLSVRGQIIPGSQFRKLHSLLIESKFNLLEFKKVLARDVAVDSGWSIKASTALIERHDFNIAAMYQEYATTTITAMHLVE